MLLFLMTIVYLIVFLVILCLLVDVVLNIPVTNLQEHDQLKREIQEAGGALHITIGSIECLVWLLV